MLNTYSSFVDKYSTNLSFHREASVPFSLTSTVIYLKTYINFITSVKIHKIACLMIDTFTLMMLRLTSQED